ncbi:hypothetical protein HYC85_029908 [Camellia sinensis]|uniref:Uncharacterized protein n=1 Tax=Camellia sinensis TaxID=4442 RepID=A0A7J7FZW8_CAMSI|nr:hypothetical protein HYC85_029908 [Camellia sinensis]
MASSHDSLTLFPDLNESTIEMTDSDSPEPQPQAPPVSPVFSFSAMSIEQIMVAQSDIETNSYTLRSCVETVTVVSNLSRRLQNRTCKVHQLNAQLSLLQRMYKDARVKISALKKQNKELKRQATSVARFGVSSHNQFDGWRGIISFGSSAKAEAESSRASKE